MSDLPFLTADCLGIGGVLKQREEDFVVEEIPAYPASGTGDHLFLWVEKRGLSARELTRHLAAALGIAAADIGMAGLKDKRAITRQFVSVPADSADRLPAVETDAVHVLDAQRHGNKLRTGQLRGNRFDLLVRDVAADALPRAQAMAAEISRIGFPNYFGEQRFGRDGETAELGFALLRGDKRPGDIPYKQRRFLLKLALSAAQAEIFNAALAERIRDGLLTRVLPGDVMQVVESRGPFVVEDVATEQQRYDAGETTITGPLFGPKMKRPTGEALEREQKLLAQFDLDDDAFRQYRKLTTGTRRPYAIRPQDLDIAATQDGLRFRFTLPAGVYATTLLREFLKIELRPDD